VHRIAENASHRPEEPGLATEDVIDGPLEAVKDQQDAATAGDNGGRDQHAATKHRGQHGVNQNIKVPTILTAKDRALKDRLDNLSGEAFDRAYMNAMVRDHRSDVAEFRTETENAKVAEVRQYASHTLPTLEDHLKLAREIDHSVAAKSETPRGKTS
jgi:putative membrane protein